MRFLVRISHYYVANKGKIWTIIIRDLGKNLLVGGTVLPKMCGGTFSHIVLCLYNSWFHNLQLHNPTPSIPWYYWHICNVFLLISYIFKFNENEKEHTSRFVKEKKWKDTITMCLKSTLCSLKLCGKMPETIINIFQKQTYY